MRMCIIGLLFHYFHYYTIITLITHSHPPNFSEIDYKSLPLWHYYFHYFTYKNYIVLLPLWHNYINIYIIHWHIILKSLLFLMYVPVVFATVVPDDNGQHSADEDHRPSDEDHRRSSATTSRQTWLWCAGRPGRLTCVRVLMVGLTSHEKKRYRDILY